MKKILLCAFILLLLFLTAAIFLLKDETGQVLDKDIWLRNFFTGLMKEYFGSEVSLDNFSWDIGEQSLKIEGFKVYNPPDFPQGVMLDLPYIKILYAAQDLLKGKLDILQIIIDFREIKVIKNSQGKINIDTLPVIADSDKRLPETNNNLIEIDLFTLSIGRVVSQTYDSNGRLASKTYNLDIINQNYKDIPDIEHLIVLMVQKSLEKTAIKGSAFLGVLSASGAGLLPLGITAIIVSKDSAQVNFKSSFDKVYDASLEIIRQKGRITSANKQDGLIKAELAGHSVVFKVAKVNASNTKIRISSRKTFLPKAEFSRDLLYQVSERLHGKMAD